MKILTTVVEPTNLPSYRVHGTAGIVRFDWTTRGHVNGGYPETIPGVSIGQLGKKWGMRTSRVVTTVTAAWV